MLGHLSGAVGMVGGGGLVRGGGGLLLLISCLPLLTNQEEEEEESCDEGIDCTKLLTAQYLCTHK